MRRALWIIGLWSLATPVFAAPTTITYTYNHHIVTVNVGAHPEWRHRKRTWTYLGLPAIPPSRFLSCGSGDILEPGWTYQDETGWNEETIGHTIADDVASKIDRPAGNVIITRSASGSVSFEGQGLTGRSTDIVAAATLTKAALESDIATIVLPVTETQPAIDVRDPELQTMGIREVVTIGESVFARSPVNRRHNIGVGVEKFNGHLIPQGSVFSFVETLGPVNDRTGYRKELVIQGETTLPDYGGGLCQVSSTAYRGPWEYGLPIVQRKNHSYAVSYYSPQGTDATIYPPNVDMKFLNNTPGALLIQSFTDAQDRAFFIYYGTRDERKTEVFGPFITDRKPAPTVEKTVYTTEIPPGERQKAGERHDGMKAVWYREITTAGSGTVMERFFSDYEARPLTWQVGVTAEDKARLTGKDLSVTPSWLPSKDETNAASSSSR